MVLTEPRYSSSSRVAQIWAGARSQNRSELSVARICLLVEGERSVGDGCGGLMQGGGGAGSGRRGAQDLAGSFAGHAAGGEFVDAGVEDRGHSSSGAALLRDVLREPRNFSRPDITRPGQLRRSRSFSARRPNTSDSDGRPGRHRWWPRPALSSLGGVGDANRRPGPEYSLPGARSPSSRPTRWRRRSRPGTASLYSAENERRTGLRRSGSPSVPVRVVHVPSIGRVDPGLVETARPAPTIR